MHAVQYAVLQRALWQHTESTSRGLQGPELETPSQDFLHTTPQALAATVNAVITAYDTQSGAPSAIGAATSLMQPSVVSRLRELKEQLHQWSML